MKKVIFTLVILVILVGQAFAQTSDLHVIQIYGDRVEEEDLKSMNYSSKVCVFHKCKLRLINDEGKAQYAIRVKISQFSKRWVDKGSDMSIPFSIKGSSGDINLSNRKRGDQVSFRAFLEYVDSRTGEILYMSKDPNGHHISEFIGENDSRVNISYEGIDTNSDGSGGTEKGVQYSKLAEWVAQEVNNAKKYLKKTQKLVATKTFPVKQVKQKQDLMTFSTDHVMPGQEWVLTSGNRAIGRVRIDAVSQSSFGKSCQVTKLNGKISGYNQKYRLDVPIHDNRVETLYCRPGEKDLKVGQQRFGAKGNRVVVRFTIKKRTLYNQEGWKKVIVKVTWRSEDYNSETDKTYIISY